MLAAWVLFPLVLGALCLGWGWLLGAVARVRIAPALLPGAGMAAIVVVGQALTYADASAELATPVIAVGASVGTAAATIRRWGRPPGWAVAAAAAVFGVYAAPVVLSGEATIAGFIKLDDTATWLALTDRIMEHGRSLDGLELSTYEATLAFNLDDGYPVGAFVPLGAAAALVGEDVAWVVQPYMAFWGALLALALWALARGIVAARWARAAIASVAAQPALLLGYYLWGGVKEVAATALIASAAALLPAAVAPGRARQVVPLGVAAAAVIAVLSGGGAVWLLPLGAAGVYACVRRLGWRAASRRAAAVAGIVLVTSVPVLLSGGIVPPTSAPLTDADAIGNLAGPLELAQVAGIWPAGDFRFDPELPALTYGLIGLALLGAILGLALSWRRDAWWAIAFVGGGLASALALVVVGSPWVEGKALAVASVAVPFAALLGFAGIAAAGRTGLAVGLAALVAGGVVWSNALAYRGVNLAPREQLAELEEIGGMIEGEGPTLMTEYSPYGARHFLRAGDPESVSDLRRRRIPLASGGQVRKGRSADTDELAADALLVYPSLVLRRSPARSRPPSPYRLVWAGADYELWQRDAGPPPQIRRMPLGSERDPTGIARCEEVRELAERAPPGGTLAAARQPRSLVVRLGDDLEARVSAPRGEYEAWVRGSVSTEATLAVDGVEAGSARHVLNNEGGYVRLGDLELAGGSSRLTLDLGGPDLHPGSGEAQPEVGPLVLEPAAPEPEPVSVPASEAKRLCGERLDWIEAATR